MGTSFEVYCDGCKEFVSTASVKHIDVTTDGEERDVLVFICSCDGKEHRGIIRGQR